MTEFTRGRSLDVLLLAEQAPPKRGGRAAILADLLRHLPGDTTQLVAPGGSGAAAFDRTVAPTIRRRPTYVPAPFTAFVLRKHLEWTIKKYQPGLVVAFGLQPEGKVALSLFRESGTPFLLHLGVRELLDAQREIAKGSARGRAVQTLLDECTCIVTSSNDHRLEAYRTGVLPHHLHVSPVGVDLKRFAPGPRDKGLADRLSVGRGPVLVTVAGGPATDMMTIFRAFAAIRGQLRDSALVVLGETDERRWSKELKQLRVDRSVRFTGLLPPERMPEHFRLGDLFLTAHLEKRETGVAQGCGVTLVEAIACGLPVVGTRTPITEEHAPHGVAGELVEVEAHAKLARAATDILRSDERRTLLAAAAREHAETHHDAAVTAAEFREFLEVVYFRRLGLGNLEAAAPAPEGSARPAA